MRNHTRIFLVIIALLPLLGASGPDSVKEWGWSLERANPYYCATELSEHYDVNLLMTHDSIAITIYREGKNLFAFKGHRATVFAIKDGILYYVNYNYSGNGGTVIAIDLANGKELWSTELQAIPPKTHSTYSNFINISPEKQGLRILGAESGGDYIEVLDYKAGKQISHEIVNQSPKK